MAVPGRRFARWGFQCHRQVLYTVTTCYSSHKQGAAQALSAAQLRVFICMCCASLHNSSCIFFVARPP